MALLWDNAEIASLVRFCHRMKAINAYGVILNVVKDLKILHYVQNDIHNIFCYTLPL